MLTEYMLHDLINSVVELRARVSKLEEEVHTLRGELEKSEKTKLLSNRAYGKMTAKSEDLYCNTVFLEDVIKQIEKELNNGQGKH